MINRKEDIIKKLISIITMLLVEISISGCGSSVATEVTVEPTGELQILTVGKDIAEGTYTYEVSGSDEIVGGVITTPGSLDYDTLVNKKLVGATSYELPKHIILSEGNVILIKPSSENDTVTIKQK